ncbi:hypothetical protein G6F42_013061 [Rhizopus arrhizus]|nr:hypothetical protein G6F42_013061 [Rhizopus arrhizus]
MNDKQFKQLQQKPYHLYFIANLVDVPMLMDIVGPVAEARQRLELVYCTVLPSNVHVPDGFVNRARSTFMPYTFLPGPQAGYYLVKMTGEARFVPASTEEEPNETFDDDIDFGFDHFEEVAGPCLSTFDADLKSRKAPQAEQQSGNMIRALQRQVASKEQASSPQPAAKSRTLSAKAAGKQRASTIVTGEAIQSTSTGTTTTAATGQATSVSTRTQSSISSSPEADYLGLLSMVEEPTKQTEYSKKSRSLLSRLGKQVATSAGLTKINAEIIGESSDEITDDQLSAGLKRVRTTESQSSTSTRQMKKKSKTLILLKQLQKKSKNL